jgi:uroporphyrinogen-III synthase
VAKKKSGENSFKKAQDQLLVFKQISRFFAREQPIHEVLHSTVMEVMRYLEADSCFLYLKQADYLVLCASNHNHDPDLGEVRLHFGEGLTGWVARERRLLALPRAAFQDTRFKKFTTLDEDTFEAFLSGPIVCRNAVLGVLNVQHRRPHVHSGDDMEFLTAVGELLGSLILLSSVEKAALHDTDLAAFVLESARATAGS